jgi:uncharacterized protein (DUF433 family)
MTRSTFTTAEAQAITGRPTKVIQKLIERDVICCRGEERGARARRLLEPADLLMVLIVDAHHDLLTARLRRSVHRRLHEVGADLAGVERLEVEDFISLRVEPLLRRLTEGLERLEEARAMVVEDPRILGGEPVLRGTRIPVHQVAVLANTMTEEEVLEGYPTLRREQLEAARLYARAYPQQGRPTGSSGARQA